MKLKPIHSTYNVTKGSELKALERLAEKTSNENNCRCVLITHVLPTAEHYIRLVHKVFPVVLVIAIPYSADRKLLNSLEMSGIPTFLPESIDEAFLKSGPLVEELLQASEVPLVVQEVGGYLAGYTRVLSSYPHFLGIVEDTNNGHWRYQQAGSHLVPIVSLAQSQIRDIADTVIGDSVTYSAERIFREEFNSILQGMHVGVIGYGKIGSSTATALRGRETSVIVYDMDPAKCIKARFEGHRIVPLHALLQESELVFGCTGKTSVRENDLPYLREGAILVSASAKNEEFDLQAFDRTCRKQEISPIVWLYTQPDGKTFYVLNQGTPVNFRDRSILGFVLDLIYSELFVCINYVVKGEAAPCLQHSPHHLTSEVAKIWLEVYEPPFAASTNDKVWTYPDSLGSALTHTFFLQIQHGKRAQIPAPALDRNISTGTLGW